MLFHWRGDVRLYLTLLPSGVKDERHDHLKSETEASFEDFDLVKAHQTLASLDVILLLLTLDLLCSRLQLLFELSLGLDAFLGKFRTVLSADLRVSQTARLVFELLCQD